MTPKPYIIGGMPTAQKASAQAPQAPTSPNSPPAASALKKGDHVFLVDGSGYVFRAYHALPPITRKSDGLQLNAVFGFCNMLWKLLRDMKPEDKPTHLAVVFDKSEKTFRTTMYPDYKAHRPDAPDDLIPQFKFIREAVHAFDLPCLEQSGFEADDLIATYARFASEAGAKTSIVSSDKDLMQLVSDSVTMFDTMKDKTIGRAEVIEKFGVPPEKVIEVQSLIGDSTDNVPGVPGIGVKTAAQLIGEYGDLETLLARAGEIKQEKRRQSLIEHAELARMSKKLVTLDTNVALDVPIGDLAVHEPDYKALIGFLKAMEFNSLTRRVAEFSGTDVAQIEAASRLSGSDRAATSNGDGEAGAAPQLALGRPPQPGDLSRQGRPEASQTVVLTPKALADARREAARTAKFDRSQYETVRSLDRLKAWVQRAWDVGAVALHAASSASIRCRRSCAASRSRWDQTRPATCRCRTVRAARAPACSAATLLPTRLAKPPRSMCSSRSSPTGRAQNRPRPEIRLADVRAARHRDRILRRYYSDVVCGRCRPRRPCAGVARRADLQPRRHRHQRIDQGRQGEDHLRRRRHRPRHRIFRRARRHHLPRLAGAVAAACRRDGAQRL